MQGDIQLKTSKQTVNLGGTRWDFKNGLKCEVLDDLYENVDRIHM